jgi:transposase
MRKQKSPAELGFTRFDRMRLQKALKAVSDKRTFLRLKAVLLCAEGMAVQVVAQLFEMSFQIVYRWVSVYLKRHNTADLFDAPRSGRPLAAQDITEERILRALKRNPLELGYQTAVWTVEILADHLSRCYGCQIRPFTLYRRMKQIGLVCKRPRYVYSEKDPHRAQKKGRLSES